MLDACSQLFQSNLQGLILSVSKRDENGQGRGLDLDEPDALPILENFLVLYHFKNTHSNNRMLELTDIDRC